MVNHDENLSSMEAILARMARLLIEEGMAMRGAGEEAALVAIREVRSILGADVKHESVVLAARRIKEALEESQQARTVLQTNLDAANAKTEKARAEYDELLASKHLPMVEEMRKELEVLRTERDELLAQVQRNTDLGD